MNEIQLKDLPDDAIVQILCNGDYCGVERELHGPMTKKEFMQELLDCRMVEDAEDENEIKDIFCEWELPDGAPTNHLLTCINGNIMRVCTE